MIEQLINHNPDFLAVSAKQSGFFPATLLSQSYNESIGRYDILFAAPDMEMVAYNQQQFSELLTLIDCQPNAKAGQLPFQSGWFVYFSYESAYLMEPKLAHLVTPSEHPLAIAIHCQGAVVHDRTKQQTWVCGATTEVVEEIIRRVNKQPAWLPQQTHITDWHEEPGEQFMAAVEQARSLIRSGDVYQANLSRQYTCRLAQGVSAADVMMGFTIFAAGAPGAA